MAHNSGDDRYSVTIVDIDDPAAANAGSELFDLHAVQLQSRPFKARRTLGRYARLSDESLASATVFMSWEGGPRYWLVVAAHPQS
jgi:hypothetical protein